MAPLLDRFKNKLERVKHIHYTKQHGTNFAMPANSVTSAASDSYALMSLINGLHKEKNNNKNGNSRLYNVSNDNLNANSGRPNDDMLKRLCAMLVNGNNSTDSAGLSLGNNFKKYPSAPAGTTLVKGTDGSCSNSKRCNYCKDWGHFVAVCPNPNRRPFPSNLCSSSPLVDAAFATTSPEASGSGKEVGRN